MNSDKLDLTAIILTKNEEANIAACLQALRWVPQIIVMDSESTDRTKEITTTFNNVEFYSSAWLGFGSSKQKAMTYAHNNWILWIDADEIVTPELSKEIQNFLCQSQHCHDTVVRWCRRNFFIGKEIKHCLWSPDWVTRLFHKSSASFDDKLLHEGLKLKGKVNTVTFKSSLLHHSYPTLWSYFFKMLRYGKPGALELQRQGRHFSFIDLFFRPPFAFVKSYLFKKGFLDGTAGFIISLGTAFSVFIRYSYFYYLEKKSYEKD